MNFATHALRGSRAGACTPQKADPHAGAWTLKFRGHLPITRVRTGHAARPDRPSQAA